MSTIEQDWVDVALKSLDWRLSEIVRKRFGIYSERKTLKEIGKEFGIGAKRVSQLEASALRKLRSPKTLKKIKDLVETDEETNWGFGRIAHNHPIPPPEGCRWVSQWKPEPQKLGGKSCKWKISDAIGQPLVGEWAGYVWKCGNTLIFEGSDRRGVLIPKERMDQVQERISRIGYNNGTCRWYNRKWNRIGFFNPEGKAGKSMVWLIAYRS